MKKVLMLLGALVCLMVAGGGGLIGCTAEITVEVDLNLPYQTITLDPGIGVMPKGKATVYRRNVLGRVTLPDPYDPLHEKTFAYWETFDGNNVGKYYTVSTIPPDAVTLYAKWR
jgi:hypothetical protein